MSDNKTITLAQLQELAERADARLDDLERKSGKTNIGYGTCPTAAATAAKVITTENTDWVLAAGSIITVKFDYTNTASNPTFNVNGTGAKSVWYGTAALTTSSLSYAGYAKRPSIYMYDGTNFVFLGWSYDANTTYSNASLGQGYATCSTAAATTAKTASLSSYALTTGGIVAVKFTYDVPAGATLNVNSKGAKSIYHRGAAIKAGVILAGDTATFIYNGSYYHLISVDRDEDTTNYIIDIEIATGSWATNTDTDALNAGYNYYADVTISDLTANDYAETTLDMASIAAAKTAGMAGICETSAGKIRYYAEAVPTANLSAKVAVIRCG